MHLKRTITLAAVLIALNAATIEQSQAARNLFRRGAPSTDGPDFARMTAQARRDYQAFQEADVHRTRNGEARFHVGRQADGGEVLHRLDLTEGSPDVERTAFNFPARRGVVGNQSVQSSLGVVERRALSDSWAVPEDGSKLETILIRRFEMDASKETRGLPYEERYHFITGEVDGKQRRITTEMAVKNLTPDFSTSSTRGTDASGREYVEIIRRVGTPTGNGGYTTREFKTIRFLPRSESGGRLLHQEISLDQKTLTLHTSEGEYVINLELKDGPDGRSQLSAEYRNAPIDRADPLGPRQTNPLPENVLQRYEAQTRFSGRQRMQGPAGGMRIERGAAPEAPAAATQRR